MKKIILATIIGMSATSNSFAECTYNFDASLQDLKAFETAKAGNSTNYRYVEQVANINNANQSGYDVIRYYSNKNVDTFLASKKYIQFKTQYPFDTPDNVVIVDKAIGSADIFVQEFIFDVNNLKVNLGNNSQMYEYGFIITGSSESKVELTLNLMFAKGNNYSGVLDGDAIASLGATYKSDGNGYLTYLSANRTNNPVQVPADGKVRVGIYVNQNTKQVGYIINGMNYGYLNLTMENKLKYMSFMGAINQDHFANSALTGKMVGLQLVTDKSKMQFTYPTGAKDICGVAL
ncbi:DUF4882 family protein [Acinetobacter seifertii]|uniref:DUF4882 family protein n=1 Tax=Acinetobacter seifertii TaxID=1530123 RepID=UPI0019042AFB|nr:DUF4882 family protein [Acinetobacter seifertii]MBJ9425738.1 DUF4882 family protein [Acinetobacter seifertii]